MLNKCKINVKNNGLSDAETDSSDKPLFLIIQLPGSVIRAPDKKKEERGGRV